MPKSMLVYTKEDEHYPADDISFWLDGVNYVFSARKDNRLMILDYDTAQRLMEAYPGTFTEWAVYKGEAVELSSDWSAVLDDVAVVMVNHRTLKATRTAYESFRKFYPTIQVFLVDNGSKDGSTEYIENQHNEHTHNIMNPYNLGHGPAIHMVAGIARAIGYKYILTLDSDTITKRGGFIEKMLVELGNGYAIGKTYQKDPRGFVNNSERGITYVHPATALYNLEQYAMLRPFELHGAPCQSNMIDANLRGMRLVSFPIEDYVEHTHTGTVKVIKMTDVNAAYIFAQRTPLVSFVVRYENSEGLKACVDSIRAQTCLDYEIVPIAGWDDLAEKEQNIIRVRGLYIYILDNPLVDVRFVETVREIARDQLYPDMIVLEPGVMRYHNLIVRRELWMTCSITHRGRWDDLATIEDAFARKDWQDHYLTDRIKVNG